MIRLGRRASLLVALWLLTSAATAYAECAWVMWSRTITVRGGATSSDDWTSVAAWNTKAECESSIDRALTRWKNKGRDSLAEYGVDGGTVLMKFKNGGTSFMTYTCLPDTVDPRGPKGSK